VHFRLIAFDDPVVRKTYGKKGPGRRTWQFGARGSSNSVMSPLVLTFPRPATSLSPCHDSWTWVLTHTAHAIWTPSVYPYAARQQRPYACGRSLRLNGLSHHTCHVRPMMLNNRLRLQLGRHRATYSKDFLSTIHLNFMACGSGYSVNE
jgi:hypothetical protein